MQNAMPSFSLESILGSGLAPDTAHGRDVNAGPYISPPGSGQEIHFLISEAAGRVVQAGDAASAPPPGFASVPLPPGPSRLLRQSSGDAALDLPDYAPWTVATIEPVRTKHRQLRLLIVQSAPYTLCLNGLPAPRVAVAKEKDFLQWDDGAGFHVAIFRRPFVGPPPPSLLGKECPICRVVFTADSRCFVCPECQAGLHCEDDRAGGLECALLRANPRCPTCGQDVSLKPAFGYHPEVDHA